MRDKMLVRQKDVHVNEASKEVGMRLQSGFKINFWPSTTLTVYLRATKA